jgi:hypothetical protein
MIRPRRPLTASAFLRRVLASKTPPELFWVEGDAPDPRMLPGEELQFVSFPLRAGFMKVPERPRPLQILGDDGKTWIYFRISVARIGCRRRTWSARSRVRWMLSPSTASRTGIGRQGGEHPSLHERPYHRVHECRRGDRRLRGATSHDDTTGRVRRVLRWRLADRRHPGLEGA